MSVGLTAADFEEIRQLHARYCHTVDFGDLDGVLGCFAPHGSFEIASNPGATRRGTHQLRQSIGARDGKGHIRHTTLNSLIDGDADTARSLSTVLITADFGPPAGRGQATHSAVVATGRYLDDLVRLDGHWVYERRCFAGNGGDTSERLGAPLDIRPVDAGPPADALSALDHEAIGQLLARADHALDYEDYDGFADCFVVDGSFEEVIRQEARPETRLTARGRRELHQYAIMFGDLGYRGHVHHDPLSVLVEGDGRRAKVSSYVLATMDFGPAAQPRQHGNGAVRLTGLRRDEVVKTGHHWLLARRTVRLDTLPQVEALVGAPLDLEAFDG